MSEDTMEKKTPPAPPVYEVEEPDKERVVTVNVDSDEDIERLTDALFRAGVISSTDTVRDALENLLPFEPTPEPEHAYAVIRDRQGKIWRATSDINARKQRWTASRGRYWDYESIKQPVEVLFEGVADATEE